MDSAYKTSAFWQRDYYLPENTACIIRERSNDQHLAVLPGLAIVPAILVGRALVALALAEGLLPHVGRQLVLGQAEPDGPVRGLGHVVFRHAAGGQQVDQIRLEDGVVGHGGVNQVAPVLQA